MLVGALAALPIRAAEPAAGAAPAEPAGEVILEEIEVKSRREPRVDALDVREVRETPARDLGEALEQGLALGKVRKAGIANDVVLRGMKKDDISVLVDGAQVHGACPSRMDPPAFHLDYAEVDRVEVRRGPFDVTQPGGLGGVVDVRTRAVGAGAGTELNAGAASSGQLETSGVVSYGAERAGLLLGGAFKQGDPYRSGDGRNITTVATGTARFRDTSGDRTAYDVRTGWAKLTFVPATGQQLDVAYTRQSAVDVLYPFLAMDGIEDDTDRVNATWRLEQAGGPISRARAQVFWSRVEHGMDDRERCSSAADTTACTGDLPRSYSMRTLARSSAAGGKLEGVVGDAQRLVEATVGADFHLRNWDNATTRVARMAPGMPYATEASIPDVTSTGAGVYAELRRALRPGLRVTVAGRLDVSSSSAEVDRSALYRRFHAGLGPDLDRTDVLSAGNVQVDWDVTERAALFLGFGHGMRLPDPQERYMALSGMMGRPDWVGNPDLDPSRSEELDLGGKVVAGGLLVKAQVFHAWVADHVTLANLTVPVEGGTATAKTYRNVSARLYGGEASARVALPLDLYASGTLTYARGENETAGTPLAELPPLRASVGLRWDVGRLFAEVEEQWAARQDRVDPALQELPTDAWFITNARVGGEWRGVKAFLGVRNAFDKLYYEHLSYQRDPFAAGLKVPEPGRTFLLAAQYAR